MPDPLLYLRALAAAIVIAAAAVWALRRRFSTATGGANSVRLAAFELSLVALAVVVSSGLLGLRPATPPSGALDRLLLVVLPLAWTLEAAAAWRPPRRSTARIVSLLAAAGCVYLLLYGSVYLQAGEDGRSLGDAAFWIVPSVGLALQRESLQTLANRSSERIVVFSLAACLFVAGLLIALGGYLKGGAAAVPLAGAFAGWSLVRRRAASAADNASAVDAPHARITVAVSPLVGAAVVGLFGLLFVGRYFGRLTDAQAAIVFLTPSLGWIARRISPRCGDRRQTIVHLLLVLVPLAFLLVLAKADFDRRMGPLLQTPVLLDAPSGAGQALSEARPSVMPGSSTFPAGRPDSRRPAPAPDDA